MSEYDLYTRILAPKFKTRNQDTLIEIVNVNKTQRVSIISDKKIVYTLYRYDQTEQGELFFPFFNNTHDNEFGKAPIPAPDDLLKFCDYILLAEKNKLLYVLLLELKSGDNGDASKQLDASATFMDYIKRTASRIAEANGYLNFKEENIYVRKVVLKPFPKGKPFTNAAKSKEPRLNLNDSPIYYKSDLLPLHLFCKDK